MNAQTYLEVHGKTKFKAVVEEAGTTWGYMHQILKRERRPSVELAKKLVKASNNELDFVSLLAEEKV